MNSTTALCGHTVIAVGAPGSHARSLCEQSPCDDCCAAETEALSALLRSHPKHGMRPLSVNDCLRCRAVPQALKTAYLVRYAANYGNKASAT